MKVKKRETIIQEKTIKLKNKDEYKELVNNNYNELSDDDDLFHDLEINEQPKLQDKEAIKDEDVDNAFFINQLI